MARKRSGQITLGKGSSGQRENRKSTRSSVPGRDRAHKRKPRAPHWTQLTTAQRQDRTASLELVRLRRGGLTWEDAEERSGITREIANNFLPGAFYRDELGRHQVRGYDPYTRRLKIPTTRPGEFRWLSARGSHKASLVGTWLNALKAAGQGDFSLIDKFPRNIVIDGFRLPTSHHKVSRIIAAAAESDKAFEDIYALVGAA